MFSTHRVLRQPDDSYQRLCRELVFYRDLKTGQLLDQWDNPYSGERVRVVDIANDPFNFRISEFFPDPPSYGGLNTAKPPKRPLLLEWTLVNDHTVTLDSDIHLYYRNALDPAVWPRESSGPMNRVSEFFRYFIRREDAEDPSKTHLPHNGVWSRVTPWLPWMLMGPDPGHVLYMGRFTSIERPEQAPPPRSSRGSRERFPLYLTAPDKWVGAELLQPGELRPDAEARPAARAEARVALARHDRVRAPRRIRICPPPFPRVPPAARDSGEPRADPFRLCAGGTRAARIKIAPAGMPGIPRHDMAVTADVVDNAERTGMRPREIFEFFVLLPFGLGLFLGPPGSARRSSRPWATRWPTRPCSPASPGPATPLAAR